MKTEYNTQAFVPEEVEQGLFNKLIEYFLFYNKTSQEHYIDFHVTTDGYCTIVDWIEVPYNHEWGGSFEYVQVDEYVMHDLELPDGTYMRSTNEIEDKEIIDDFIANNPDYEYDWALKKWIKKQ